MRRVRKERARRRVECDRMERCTHSFAVKGMAPCKIKMQ